MIGAPAPIRWRQTPALTRHGMTDSIPADRAGDSFAGTKGVHK